MLQHNFRRTIHLPWRRFVEELRTAVAAIAPDALDRVLEAAGDSLPAGRNALSRVDANNLGFQLRPELNLDIEEWRERAAAARDEIATAVTDFAEANDRHDEIEANINAAVAALYR